MTSMTFWFLSCTHGWNTLFYVFKIGSGTLPEHLQEHHNERQAYILWWVLSKNYTSYISIISWLLHLLLIHAVPMSLCIPSPLCVSGMVSALDEAIGNITDALEDGGFMENALIVFTTDVSYWKMRFLCFCYVKISFRFLCNYQLYESKDTRYWSQ